MKFIMKNKNKLLTIIVFAIMLMNIVVHAADNPTCQGIFGNKLIDEVKSVLGFIQIAVPVILAVLTMLDFAKAVFAQDKDGLNKAKNNFVKRTIAALIVFFAPYIIPPIMKLVEDSTVDSSSCFNGLG